MKKVNLRAVEPEDVDFMLECESDREALQWSDFRAPLSRTMLQTYSLTYDADPFSAGQLRLIVEDADKKRAGIIDLYDISERDSRGFIGICVHPSLRRQGLATASLHALEDFNRDTLGLSRLHVKISTQNPAALELFKKAGFKLIAILPKWHRIGTRFHDFQLLEKNFIDNQLDNT